MTTAADLYHLEHLARRHADSERRHWEAVLADTGCPAETRVYAKAKLADCDGFDRIGDMLMGLQGDWDRIAPLVRAGYLKQAAEYRRLKDHAAASVEGEAA